MNYMAAITDFFKSPKWVTNLLLAAVCCLIPVVGPMVVLGWVITGFWSRQDENPATFPDFDFGKFVAWLQRGLWPILVAIAASLVLYLIFVIPIVIISLVLGSKGQEGGGGFLALIGTLIIFGLQVVMMLAFTFLLKPIMLRATLAQDFVPAFDFKFVKRFVSLVWLEILVSTIFMTAAAFVLGLAGMIALCVGIFVVPPIIYFAMIHLDKQLYRLYLSRGGEPVPVSPKLSDSAPAIPA